MKKKFFALLNISTILLSLFLTGCSEKNSKITLNNTQCTYIKCQLKIKLKNIHYLSIKW